METSRNPRCEVRDRGGLLAQAGERGGGLEARRGVGGLLVRLGVQGDAVVPAQVPHERRVQAGRLGDLDLQLVPAPGAAAHRQGHVGRAARAERRSRRPSSSAVHAATPSNT